MSALATTCRILYLDPFSGISGNMLLGALLDLGLDEKHLRSELAKLNLEEYELKAETVMRGGIRGTHFEVILPGHEQHHEHSHGHGHGHGHEHGHEHGHDHSDKRAPKKQEDRDQKPAASSQQPVASSHHHRHHSDIRALIEKSDLSARVKEQSLRAFEVLAEAEGKMHGKPADKVAFHEVGAVDSIIDFVGACIGLEALDIDEVWCGPVALGGEGEGGYVKCAHGSLPVPAFAALELMKGLPIRPCGVAAELTTPTGAALVRTLATQFGPLPPIDVQALGYGAGTRNDPHIPIPNILRVVLGIREGVVSREEGHAVAGSQQPVASSQQPVASSQQPVASSQTDTIIELSANIDDATPEELGCLAEQLMELGALDVFFTPIQMKKFRPATLLTVLVEPKLFDAVTAAIFRGSSTFGVRYEMKSRVKLARQMGEVATTYGEVRVKLGFWKGELVSVHPEYDDCRARAAEKGVTLREVVDAARRAADLCRSKQEK